MTVQLGQLTEPQFLIGVTLALTSLLTAIIVFMRKAWPVFSRVKTLIDDWVGEPARPGVNRVPGVMERLSDIERASREASFHSQPNHGTSSHDTVIRKLDRIESTQRKNTGILDESVADRKQIWQAIHEISKRH